MADPLSMIASICAVCTVSVRIIKGLSEFIDEVHHTPTEVQALSSELASLYASLGHMKLAIQAPRIHEVPEAWTTDFVNFMQECTGTMTELQKVVDNAKITEINGSANQMWRTVRFTFKSRQIEVLRKRLLSENDVLSRMLLVLADFRGGHLERRLEDIHDKVEMLVSSRQNVRETLVILEKDDNVPDQADYVLSDRTSRRRNDGNLSSSSKPAPATESTRGTDNTPAQNLTAWMQSAAGKAAFASIAGQLTASFEVQSGTAESQLSPVASAPAVTELELQSGTAESQLCPVASALTAFELEVQSGTAESRLSPLASVLAATELDPAERRALSIASSKTWPVEKVRIRKLEEGAWLDVQPSDLGLRSFKAQLQLVRLLHLSVISERDEYVETSVGQINHMIYCADVYISGRTVGIFWPTDWADGLPEELIELEGSRFEIDYNLASTSDAIEMYDCVKQLRILQHKCWSMHAIAFRHTISDLDVDTSEGLRKASIIEAHHYRAMDSGCAAGVEDRMGAFAAGLFWGHGYDHE